MGPDSSRHILMPARVSTVALSFAAALVIDFSKYVSRVLDLDVEGRTVTVEPGASLESRWSGR